MRYFETHHEPSDPTLVLQIAAHAAVLQSSVAPSGAQCSNDSKGRYADSISRVTVRYLPQNVARGRLFGSLRYGATKVLAGYCHGTTMFPSYRRGTAIGV